MSNPQNGYYVLKDLVERMREPIDPVKFAGEEAVRLIVRFDLRHPMTLPATLKLVATEFQHGRVVEIDAIAKALHSKLKSGAH